MKGFGIYVKNDLLEPKHIANMGEAVWLYLWLLDKMTSINENGVGKVNKNRPISYEYIQEDIGISRQQYVRWMGKLKKHGYVKSLRTPYGLIVTVNKAEKIFGNRSIKNDTTKVLNERSIIFDTTEPGDVSKTIQLEHRDVSKTSGKMRQKRASNNNNTSNNTVDNIYVDLDKPNTTTLSEKTTKQKTYKTLFYEIVTALGFSDKVKLTTGRLQKLKVRLKNNTIEEIMTAARNIASDPWLSGDNPGAKRYGDIDYLLRSDEMIDKWQQSKDGPVDLKEYLKNVRI